LHDPVIAPTAVTMKKAVPSYYYRWLAWYLFCGVSFVVAASASVDSSQNKRAAIEARFDAEVQEPVRTARRSQLQNSSPSTNTVGNWAVSSSRSSNSGTVNLSSAVNNEENAQEEDEEVLSSKWGNDELDASNTETDDVERLNWRESQLARLHGLGPAEIAALSSWQQQRLNYEPFPKRLTKPKEFSLVSSRTHKRLVASPLHQWTPKSSTASNKAAISNNQTTFQGDEEANSLLWMATNKRNFKADNAKDSPIKNTRTGSNRKENGKNESSGNAKTSKGKGSRKQQQQKQQDNPLSRRPGQDGSGGTRTSSSDGGNGPYGRTASLGGSASPGVADNVSRMNRNLATQFLLRSPRENRQYDVPIIGKFFFHCFIDIL